MPTHSNHTLTAMQVKLGDDRTAEISVKREQDRKQKPEMPSRRFTAEKLLTTVANTPQIAKNRTR